jgi:excisionase family DNA binding protein
MSEERLRRGTYTVEEAAVVLGVSRSVAYVACRTGDIPAVRIGRRLVVPKLALDRMLSGSRDESPAFYEAHS